jgi:hypothetical protein
MEVSAWSPFGLLVAIIQQVDVTLQLCGGHDSRACLCRDLAATKLPNPAGEKGSPQACGSRLYV